MNETILDRIKALLRLSKSPEAHEAETALAKALELAAKHRIDISALKDSDGTDLMHDYWKTGKSLSDERQRAILIVQNFFHVTACICRNKGHVVLIGTDTDVAIAHYVLEYLVGACRRCLSSFSEKELKNRRRMTPAKRKGFKMGFFYGVRDRLSAQKQELPSQTPGLILAQEKARDSYLTSLIGLTTKVTLKKKRFNKEASFQGFLNGRKTEIRPGLNEGEKQLQLQ